MAETHDAGTGTSAQPAVLSPLDYMPITVERAQELVDLIVEHDNDAQIHALCELLHGITYAHFDEVRSKDAYKISVEGLVIWATRHAYSRSLHFNGSFHTFIEEALKS